MPDRGRGDSRPRAAAFSRLIRVIACSMTLCPGASPSPLASGKLHEYSQMFYEKLRLVNTNSLSTAHIKFPLITNSPRNIAVSIQKPCALAPVSVNTGSPPAKYLSYMPAQRATISPFTPQNLNTNSGIAPARKYVEINRGLSAAASAGRSVFTLSYSSPAKQPSAQVFTSLIFQVAGSGANRRGGIELAALWKSVLAPATGRISLSHKPCASTHAPAALIKNGAWPISPPAARPDARPIGRFELAMLPKPGIAPLISRSPGFQPEAAHVLTFSPALPNKTGQAAIPTLSACVIPNPPQIFDRLSAPIPLPSSAPPISAPPVPPAPTNSSITLSRQAVASIPARAARLDFPAARPDARPIERLELAMLPKPGIAPLISRSPGFLPESTRVLTVNPYPVATHEPARISIPIQVFNASNSAPAALVAFSRPPRGTCPLIVQPGKYFPANTETHMTAFSLSAAGPPAPDHLSSLMLNSILNAVDTGAVNPRNPELRDNLIWAMESSPFSPEAAKAFDIILLSAAGNSPRKKIDAVLSWAGDRAGGRYAAMALYQAAFHAYSESDLPHAQSLLQLYTERFSVNLDRVALLSALCFIRAGQNEEAAGILEKFEAEFPDSPALPGAIFFRAWIYHQQNRNEEANALFSRLIDQYENTEHARKAQHLLSSMPAGGQNAAGEE